jgi:hypothetical protein
VLWAKRMERRAAEDLRLSVLSNLALYLVAPVERWAPSVCAGLSFSFAYTFLVGLSWVFLRSSSCTAYIPKGCYVIFSYMVSSDVVYNGLHTREIHLDIHRAEGQPGQQHIYFKGDAN